MTWNPEITVCASMMLFQLLEKEASPVIYYYY